MIRLAEKKDLPDILDYAKQNYNENLYIISDIENFMYDKDVFSIWYDKVDDMINFILLKYRDNAIIFNENQDIDVQKVTELLKKNNIKRINGLNNSIKFLFPNLLHEYKIQKCKYCVLKNTGKKTNEEDKIESLNERNIEKVSIAMSKVPELDMTKEDSFYYLKNKLEKKLPTKLLELNGNIVSFAATSTVSSLSAMIVGVFSIPNMRKKGYSTKVLTALITEIFSRNLDWCLVYENDIAGKLYEKLGFNIIDEWIILTKQ